MTSSQFDRVVLISTPWPFFDRPSIQLGALKAYLTPRFPNLKIKAFHLYLPLAEIIGYRTYRILSEKTWLAESVYGALLFPERQDCIARLFYKEAGRGPASRIDFNSLVKQTARASQDCLHQIELKGLGLAGFTISFCQLTSALYFIRLLKRLRPEIIIVAGGSSVSGTVSLDIQRLFPEIDFLIHGEGELPLSRLLDQLTKPDSALGLSPIQGVVFNFSSLSLPPFDLSPLSGSTGRQADISRLKTIPWQLKDMKSLPPPDYDEYFDMLRSFTPDRRFFPVLPVEASRGCWWAEAADRHHTGCAFCNLNRQWQGYRTKDSTQVVSEVDCLTDKYKVLSVNFMDNLLPARVSEEVFSRLAALDKDFSLFGEIRASTSYQTLKAMRLAGADEVQIGIEALSTRLLEKLSKGTSAIENLEIMKNCEELGIAHQSNLIVYFPGSDEEDIAETLRNLEFAVPFRPLKIVRFWLGLGSPVYCNPRAYGLKAVFNHKNYSSIFPSSIVKAVHFTVQDYRGDLVLQRKKWAPVIKKAAEWERAYHELHQGTVRRPILSYLDGKNFLIIRQRRFGAEPMTHRLEGTSRSIYLACRRRRSFRSILRRFPQMPAERIRPFLRMMVDKKLMFEENDTYLSLAAARRPGV